MVKKIFLITTIVLFLNACSVANREIEYSPIEYDDNYINRQISLQVLDEWNDFIIGNPVSLFMTLDTTLLDPHIVFRNDFGLRIFYKENGHWIEVSQKPVIRPPDDVILSYALSKTSGIVTFYPDLPDRTKEYNMRAYVFGDMRMPDGSIQQVSAFADFKLAP
jgi:hypothetical protein